MCLTQESAAACMAELLTVFANYQRTHSVTIHLVIYTIFTTIFVKITENVFLCSKKLDRPVICRHCYFFNNAVSLTCAYSSVSSFLSASAANCWDDILRPLLDHMQEYRKAILNRILGAYQWRLIEYIVSVHICNNTQQIQSQCCRCFSGPRMSRWYEMTI